MAIRATIRRAVAARSDRFRLGCSFSSLADGSNTKECSNIAVKAAAREELWRKFFADPSKWWDNRFNQNNQRYPDFVHSITKETLWIDGWLNPPWVKARLTTLKQDRTYSVNPVRAVYPRHADVTCGGPSGAFVRDSERSDCSDLFQDLRRLSVGRLHEALEVMDNMSQQKVQIPADIFHCLLQDCINKKNIAAGRKVHFHIMQSGFESNSFLGGDLIRMFVFCESLAEANLVFSKLSQPNNYTWRAIISAHTKFGHGAEAIKLYHRMCESNVKPNGYVFVAALKACSSVSLLAEGKEIHDHIIESGFEGDIFVGSSIIDMYTKCGSLEDACKCFRSMPKPDAVTCSAMIAGYVHHGHDEKALQLFQEMQQKGIDPDKVTFVSILKASSQTAALNQGTQIHSHLINTGFESDTRVGSALITMYANCGRLEDSHCIFNRVSVQNVATWNAFIAGYSVHGDYKLALQYFEDMQKESIEPNGVTFLCLLSACRHLGQVEEAYHFFQSMTDDWGIIPTLEHYNCMVDVLGHTGCFIAAEDLLQTIPYQLNIVGWKALLNLCKSYGNVEQGKQCFEQVVMMNCRHSAGYVLLSNVFADAGMWDDVYRMEELRRCASALKIPGKASIEVQNKVHAFVVGDKSHPQNYVINKKLNQLCLQMKGKGCWPWMEVVLQPRIVEDYAVCGMA